MNDNRADDRVVSGDRIIGHRPCKDAEMTLRIIIVIPLIAGGGGFACCFGCSPA